MEYSLYWTRGWKTFSVEGQIVNPLAAEAVWSLFVTFCWDVKADINEWMGVWSSTALLNKSEQWARFGLGDTVVDFCPRQCSRALEFERNLANFFILCVSQGGSDGKASACNVGDSGSIPGLGRSSGERNSSPLQYSCLENLMETGTWPATVHGVAKSWTRLSD